MSKAFFGGGGMALAYLIFILPLSRPGKNLVLGLICAVAAVVLYLIARRSLIISANRAVPVAIVTIVMLPLLSANLLLNIDLSTIYIWAIYAFLYAIVNIVWVKFYS